MTIDLNQAKKQWTPPDDDDPPEAAFENGETHSYKPGNGSTPPPGDDAEANGAEQQRSKVNIDPDTGKPLVLNASEFVGGFTSPAYLVDGVMQRGYIYSLTARTSHGKTAVAMYMGQCIARNLPMHGRTVKTGTVLLLAGENPDDIRARFIVLGDFYGFDPNTIKMEFIPGVVSVATKLPIIQAVAATIPDLVLVIVDTAAAYFPGDDTNSNAQQGNYARLLRELTQLRGKPAVLVCCHPVKNATPDNLIPMGGSAFINEMDGNLTLWADAEKQTSLHWLGKFRGPEFEAMSFDLKVADSAKVRDAEGRLMPSVVAVPVSEADAEAGMRKQENEENRVLLIMAEYRDASFGVIATKAGFVTGGRANKTKVARIMQSLLRHKFVEKHRSGKYRLTTKGKWEIGQ